MDETAVFMKTRGATLWTLPAHRMSFRGRQGLLRYGSLLRLPSQLEDKAATSFDLDRRKNLIQKSGADYVAYHQRAWMNSDLLIKWIDLMFPALLNFCDGKWMCGTRCKRI